MDELLAALQPTVDRWGALGMAAVAAIDASSLPMPTVNDLLIVWQTIKNPHLWWYYAVFTTLGAVAGSMPVYYLGRKGGQAFLSKRLSASRINWVRAQFQRYGIWAMVAIAFAPPPTPYKVFVLLAGAGGIGPLGFAGAVALGRAARYLAEGWFARLYGEAAAGFIRLHLAEVTFAIGGLLLAGGAGWVLWRRLRAA